MKPDRHAAVAVIQAGEATMRPALFVFITPDGFAWVEPAYLEPQVPRPAFHRVAGPLTLSASGFSCEGEDGRTYLVGPVAELGEDSDLKVVCDWAESALKASGTTMDAERERLKIELADDLA